MSTHRKIAVAPAAPHEAPLLRRQLSGIAMMLTASASNQSGAAIGSLAFPIIGPVGVVAVRQLVTALVLVPLVKVPYRSMRRSQWWPVLGLALVFSVMNLSLYAAVERIGLGMAVTLEFLGPLGVAVFSSRKAVDMGCALLAGAGVLVLVRPGPTSDALGIALALLAALAWACYILLNRTLGRRLPGLQGTAAASLCCVALWVPVATIWFLEHTPTLVALGLAVACGVLASLVPYVADLLALRRVPAQLFGIFTSINPVWAVLAGMVFLGQSLGWLDLLAIGLIVAASLASSLRAIRAGQHPDAEQRAPIRGRRTVLRPGSHS